MLKESKKASHVGDYFSRNSQKVRENIPKNLNVFALESQTCI